MVNEVIKLGTQPIDNSIAAQLRRQKEIKNPFLRAATSLRTTSVLGGVLGALVLPAAGVGVGARLITGAKTTGVLGATAVGAGILATSQKARDAAKKGLIEPEQVGLNIGEIIETGADTVKDVFETGGDKVKDVFNKGKDKVKDKVKDIPTGLTGKDVLGILAGTGLAAGLIGLQQQVSDLARQRQRQPPVQQFQPLAPVQQPAEPKSTPIEVVMTPQKPTKITNTFNPTIDISFKKSKKFINQQVLIK